MNKSVYTALVIILVVYLVAGFFYFQGKPEINNEEFLNNSLNNPLGFTWNNITPEYFLTEDIFDTDARTHLTKFDTSKNEKLENMYMRRWYNENDVPFITVMIREYKDKFQEAPSDAHHLEGDIGSPIAVSEDRIRKYLDASNPQNESKHTAETKQEQDVEDVFYLTWKEDRYTFLLKAISAEYQDEIKEIAKNIIKRYPK